MIRQLLAGVELKPGVAILLVVLFVLVAAAGDVFPLSRYPQGPKPLYRG